MVHDLAASVRARLLNIAKAEKTDFNSVLVHAMVLLGMTNSRLKDYLDLSVLLEREVLDPATVAAAIAATFTRRGTALRATLQSALRQAASTNLTLLS